MKQTKWITKKQAERIFDAADFAASRVRCWLKAEVPDGYLEICSGFFEFFFDELTKRAGNGCLCE
jgi:hypothetical protein